MHAQNHLADGGGGGVLCCPEGSDLLLVWQTLKMLSHRYVSTLTLHSACWLHTQTLNQQASYTTCPSPVQGHTGCTQGRMREQEPGWLTGPGPGPGAVPSLNTYLVSSRKPSHIVWAHTCKVRQAQESRVRLSGVMSGREDGEGGWRAGR